MSVFFMVVVLIATLFLFHLVWWRISLPQQQRSFLLILFLGGSLVLAPAAAWLLQLVGLQSLNWIQWLNVGLAILSFTLTYVITYSALEGDSPTLSLIQHIAKAGERGVTFQELDKFMEQRPFVQARLSALIHEKMLIERDGQYLLAEHPYTLFKLVLFYRRAVLGINEAGG